MFGKVKKTRNLNKPIIKILATPRLGFYESKQLRLLRRLAGKGSWIFSIAPRSRWTVQRLWAAITDVTERGYTQSRNGGGFRRGLVARKQILLPLRWIVAYWGQATPPLSRTLGQPLGSNNIEVVTDASPWGLGGYLASISQGTILQYFTSPITALDVSRYGVEIGEAAGQQYWEALSILVALRLWAKLFSNGKARFNIRGDSIVALTLARKLSSSSSRLNAIGAEISLELELFQIADVFVQHTPGKLLTCADWLSRVFSPSAEATPPPELASAKQRQVPVRDESFYKVWSIAS